MLSIPLLHQVKVGEVMHEGVVTCSASDDIDQVAAVMADHGIHCVVAIDEGPPGQDDDRLWGVVSDLDLMRGIESRLDLDAGNLAELDVATVVPDDTLAHAAGTMVRRGLAHLVVVAEGRPVGVISTLDIARATRNGTSRRVVPPGGGHLRGPSFAHSRDPDPRSGGSDSRARLSSPHSRRPLPSSPL
jgi:CBS domain-containing protein